MASNIIKEKINFFMTYLLLDFWPVSQQALFAAIKHCLNFTYLLSCSPPSFKNIYLG